MSAPLFDTAKGLPDLDICDREPIHIPGAIQNHGILAVLEGADLRITQISTNTNAIAGVSHQSLLGQPIDTLLEPEAVACFRQTLEIAGFGTAPVHLPLLTCRGSRQQFQGTLHRHQGLVILEMEPDEAGAPGVARNLLLRMREGFARMEQSESVAYLCQATAELVRTLTGFDRVMVYRFLPDQSGEVIGEDKAPGSKSYLGLRFPASDIPAQARRLYLLSPLRLKCDIDAPDVPLEPSANPATGVPLDMSYAVLRAMSPVHIEYLRNMGVTASMSISIIRGNELWGLIACHHLSPRRIPFDVRIACEFFARNLASQLGLKETLEAAEYTASLQSLHLLLVRRMASHQRFWPELSREDQNIRSVIQASGAAIVGPDGVVTLGLAPSQRAILEIAEWLRATPEPVFATESLSSLDARFANLAAVVSGLLAIRISTGPNHCLMWFLPEQLETVQWAGDPRKLTVQETEGGRLSPRKSFELWEEKVRGRSRSWLACEIQFARNLRESLAEIVLRHVQAITALNEELQRSNLELEEFAYCVSHDLKEPLRGIHNFSHFLLEDYSESLDAKAIARLRTLVSLTTRMEDLMESLLEYSRAGRTELSIVDTDLAQSAAEAVEILSFRIQQRRAQVVVHKNLPRVRCDSVRVREVFVNLISNALKYCTEPNPWIEIGCQYRGGMGEPVRLFCKDNGIGIQPVHFQEVFEMFRRLHGREEFGGGTGSGLAISKRLVERHGGRMWVDSEPGKGSTFYFTLSPEP